ncbi:Homeodomain transcriptional factor [Mycena indigotica]|uniref:Homeodomain transcriptional factor n=1 Tax=Mycena indigotica TaxID=2126181 RepID=A0A8H6W8M3_9AGAR|nr:Homeodomain transcriptional factor [Mycena indigotica]KAF7307081.1 Homeodomain transcriptional factor [Mycena indigotica]
MSSTIRDRLLSSQSQFFEAISADDSNALASFHTTWESIFVDFEAALAEGTIDADTMTLAATLAERITTLSSHLIESASAEQDAVEELGNLIQNLDLNPEPTPSTSSSTSPTSPSPPPILPTPKPRRGRASVPRPSAPSLPPHIEPAYKWLLQHLYKPYPSSATITKIHAAACAASPNPLHQPTEAAIRSWFGSARRKMRWNHHLRSHLFRGDKRAMLKAARAYFGVVQGTPHIIKKEEDTDDDNDGLALKPNVKGAFVEIEALAKEMYAAQLKPSDLVGRLGSAVKGWSPDLDAQARRDKLAGKRRSTSPDYDDDLARKRPRNDDDELTPAGSPNSRKRRLSESDASGGISKRPCVRSASMPVVDVPAFDALADWFAVPPPDLDLDSVAVIPWDAAAFSLFTEDDSSASEASSALPSPSGLGLGLSLPQFDVSPEQFDFTNDTIETLLQQYSMDTMPFLTNPQGMYTAPGLHDALVFGEQPFLSPGPGPEMLFGKSPVPPLAFDFEIAAFQ